MRILALGLALILCLSFAANAEQAQQDVMLSRALDSMLPAFDSVLRCINQEGFGSYMPEDPAFTWTTLYLMGVNWSSVDEASEWSAEGVSISQDTMAAFARAALGLDALPEIPKDLRSLVAYDKAKGAYLLPGSDAGDSYARIDDYELAEDGRVSVLCSLYDGEDTHIAGDWFVLTPEADSTAHPFEYRIERMG